MDTVKLINELIGQVELAVLDMQHHTSRHPVGDKGQDYTKGFVAIQPFRSWTDQGAVLDFKAILRKRFGRAILDAQ
jgi:hypothetical protein